MNSHAPDCQQNSQTPARGQFTATIAANTPLCDQHYRLVLSVSAFPPTAPGQFLQVACRDLAAPADPEPSDWPVDQPPHFQGVDSSSLALLRRPFSLAGRRDPTPSPQSAIRNPQSQLTLIYRVVGVGSAWLSRQREGAAISIIGPLGNRFELPPADGIAILVGGGVGIPPMLYLSSALAGRKAIAFCGAVTRSLLPLTITADAPPGAPDSIEPLYNIAEFASHNHPAVITTDDGSWGFRGYVTDALERYLDRYFPDPPTRQRLTIYTCGPEPMMKRVAGIAIARDIACQVSVERAMACGMGTCQSCVIKVRRPTSNGDKPWVYKLACTDGPVFRAGDLLW